jgi:CubicO group peptidase (beta-lactamase class C family)
MLLSRRSVVAGLATLPVLLPARASAADYSDAARYSAGSRGVSFLVMQDGQVLFEDYPGEGQKALAWPLASGTKSFCGIMAAAAAADGLLSIDERCADTLPEWQDDDRKTRITIRDLLTLTSGMPGRIGAAPSYAKAIEARAKADPGRRFTYGAVPFQAFGEILRRKLAAKGDPGDPVSYLQARVLDPIGVRPAGWKRGDDGHPVLPHGARFSALSWAQFGQAVLDGGSRLDSETLEACFEGTKANPGYGLTWWLMRKGLVPPSPRSGLGGTMPSDIEAEDIVMAAGAGNQRLYLLRKRRLVVVRQATGILEALRGRGAKWEDVLFLRKVLAA